MIERQLYMNRIRPFMGTDLVKVITGIRRSGKSILLQLIQKQLLGDGVDQNRIFYYNFESLSLSDLCSAEALYKEVMKRTTGLSGKVYLFFDEIQEVDHWERAVNSFRVDLDADIYITGSNAKLLSGELATYLAGRYVEFVVYPFSFREFMDMYRNVRGEAEVHECFRQYLAFGGMPYLGTLQYEKEPCMQYLRDLYNAVELKDIIKRNNVRDVDLLERILAYVTANIGNTFSATTISRYLKSEGRTASTETVMNYLRAGSDAFLFYPVKREDLPGKKLLTVQEKYYLADHGIREAVIGGNMKDIQLVLENMVFLELLRRGYHVTVGKYQNKEIDFIAQKREQKIYIQVTYLLASEETVEREFGVYRYIRDNYPKYVLSMDEIDMSRDGIIHKNIRDFLLEEW